MDAFGDDFVENEVDPAADFLAREQNELAGLEDEIAPSNPPPLVNGNHEPAVSGSKEELDDLGIYVDEPTDPEEEEEGFTTITTPKDEEISQPLPEIVRERREEPEKIKKWREQQKKSLEEKDLQEEKKKEEWRLAAKKELDDWYKQHEDILSKTRANNRNDEKQLIIEEEEKPESGDWKRIAKLCDFNKKSTHNIKDASRMRSIILQLQQSPRNTKVL